MRGWFIISSVTVMAVLLACSRESTDPAETNGAGAADGGADASPIDIAANGTVLSIDVSPLTLTPAFSASADDYYVRCAAGDNPVTVTVTDASGTHATAMNWVENQIVGVGGTYWIRCLPHDFPTITVTHPGTPTPGYYLVNSTMFGAVFDVNGVPVWYSQGSETTNVDSPAVDTISFMPNATVGSFGTSLTAAFQIRSLETNVTTEVVAANAPTDGHELRTLSNGDYLLFTYPIESGVDLTGLEKFTADQTIADCEIQEVDASGKAVWTWLASDHVDPIRESIEPATTGLGGVSVIDVFHCNSIEVDATGNLLLSMRHANALFYIERASGKVTWKLGGSAYNKDGAALIQIQGDPETAFNMQHDARFQANGNGDVTLFDDHGATTTGVSRGVEYSIDHDTNVANVVFQFLGKASSQYEGSFRRYADGESVIGWGYIPTDPRVVTEIDANGKDVFDIAFSGMNQSYRAVKVPIAQLDLTLLRAAAGK